MQRLPLTVRWIVSILISFLVLMTLYRFLFFYSYNPAGNAFSGSAFLMGLRFDLKFLSILGISLLVFTWIPFLNPFNNRWAAAWWKTLLPLVFLGTILLYLADFFFYEYIRQRLNANVLSYLVDTSISMNMAWHTYPVIRVAIGLIIFMILSIRYFNWLMNRLKKQSVVSSGKTWPVHAIAFLVFALGVFGKFSQFNLRWSDAFTLSNNFKANVALNPFQSFFSSLRFRDTQPKESDARRHYSLMTDYLAIPKPDSTSLNYTRNFQPDSTASKNTPNVVLVICESFSMYRSSMSGNPLNTTPFFQQLCRDGVFFDRCFTPSFPTARGVWATITSLPDVLGDNNRTASRNPELVNQQTLINAFHDYGKYYFIGGDPTWANIKGLLMNNIDGLKLYSQEDFKADKVNVWGINDLQLFLETDQLLAQKKAPFFAIIQTADNHRPYAFPADGETGFRSSHPPKDSLLKYGFEDEAQYNAFRYTDYCYQEFMKAASKRDYYKNTIFVFVGDHGIPGNSDAMYPKSWNEYALTRVHVPLLFYAPGLLKPEYRHEVCSQLDILPSLATITNIPYSTQALGRSLFDLRQKPVQTEFIIDHESGTIGSVSNEYYYTKKIIGGQERLVSVRNNDPVSNDAHADSARKYMASLTEAYYQTARYLLYHNKRK